MDDIKTLDYVLNKTFFVHICTYMCYMVLKHAPSFKSKKNMHLEINNDR